MYYLCNPSPKICIHHWRYASARMRSVDLFFVPIHQPRLRMKTASTTASPYLPRTTKRAGRRLGIGMQRRRTSRHSSFKKDINGRDRAATRRAGLQLRCLANATSRVLVSTKTEEQKNNSAKGDNGEGKMPRLVWTKGKLFTFYS
jgi:hypothetical protein